MTDSPLHYEKRDNGVAIISTNDDPLNRMTLEYVNRLEEVIEETMLARNSERQSRAVDLDREGSMEEKKKEGYF